MIHKHHVLISNSESDGTSFLELTESDIKCLVPKLGVVKKICRLQSSVSWTKRACERPLIAILHSNGPLIKHLTSVYSTHLIWQITSTQLQFSSSAVPNIPAQNPETPRSRKQSYTSPGSCSSTPYPSSSSLSPLSVRDVRSPETDDTVSIASSASSMGWNRFTIPDMWRPSIMSCIQAPLLKRNKSCSPFYTMKFVAI